MGPDANGTRHRGFAISGPRQHLSEDTDSATASFPNLTAGTDFGRINSLESRKSLSSQSRHLAECVLGSALGCHAATVSLMLHTHKAELHRANIENAESFLQNYILNVGIVV